MSAASATASLIPNASRTRSSFRPPTSLAPCTWGMPSTIRCKTFSFAGSEHAEDFNAGDGFPDPDHAGIATPPVIERLIYAQEKKTRRDLGREELGNRPLWQWKDKYKARILGQIARELCSCVQAGNEPALRLMKAVHTRVRVTFFNWFPRRLYLPRQTAGQLGCPFADLSRRRRNLRGEHQERLLDLQIPRQRRVASVSERRDPRTGVYPLLHHGFPRRCSATRPSAFIRATNALSI